MWNLNQYYTPDSQKNVKETQFSHLLKIWHYITSSSFIDSIFTRCIFNFIKMKLTTKILIEKYMHV